MKGKNTHSSSRLEYFKSLYETSLSAAAEDFERYERNMSQYLGSYEIDGGESATTIRNITYEIIESQVNSDIPTPKVDSVCYSERRDRNAHSIERLCSSVKELLPFEKLNELDERYTYIYGGAVWYVEWDSSDGDGGVKVHCLSPKSFIGQAGISDIDEMEYCFLRFTTTKGELMRKYGVNAEETELSALEFEYGGDFTSDTVNLVICFYKDENGEIGKYVFSGDLALSDVKAYYRRKKKICLICEKDYAECTCIKGDHKIVDDTMETVGDKKVPYYIPKCFPIVIRKNTMGGDDGLFGVSDCDRIRPEQQAINKVESRILQKLLRSGVTPIMPEDSTVTLTNAVFGQVIKMRPGESSDNYGKLDTTPDVSQDIKEADRLYDHAKRVLGISDALQGTDTIVNESGFARQLKINQASSRLESKRRIKYLAYSKIYELIFRLYLAFADAPRVLSYKDTFGNIHLSEFNRYDFIERDKNGCFRYEDNYLFSVDLNGGNEYNREMLWEKNLSNLESGTLGDREDPVTLLRYWQSQERAHYPYARENVDYFKILVEKQTNKNESEKSENEKEEPLCKPESEADHGTE